MKKSSYPIVQKMLPYVKNKFFLTFVGALIWVGFFDRNDFITTWSYHKRLKSLCKEKAFYEEGIKKSKADLNNLMTNTANLEKYAREQYLMKKDNEDLYVVVEEGK